MKNASATPDDMLAAVTVAVFVGPNGRSAARLQFQCEPLRAGREAPGEDDDSA